MNKHILLGFLLLIGNLSNAQFTPSNQKRIGGNANDQLIRFYNPNDLSYSYLIGGSLSGISGDKTTGNFGGYDIWVVKLNANGDKVWDKTIGGNNDDYFVTAVVTDLAVFIGVSTMSDVGGNKTAPSYGSFDIWTITLDHQGNITQQQSYGGNQVDQLNQMKLIGNDLVLLGSSSSGISGNKTSANYGGSDIWVLQLDTSNLAINAQYNYGSPLTDYPSDIVKSGANYFISCSSETGLGNDKTDSGFGLYDVWVLKTDLNFMILDNKCFGGDKDDYPISMCELSGDLYFTASSHSSTSGNKTQDNFGSIDSNPRYDCWIFKMNPSNMNLFWDRAFGGTDDEQLPLIMPLDNNRLVVSVWTKSALNSGNISSPSYGLFDTKFLTIDSGGNMLTQFSMGGSGQDYCRVSLVDNGVVYFSGYSDSGISGNKTVGTSGGFDAWYCQSNLQTLGVDFINKEPLLSIYPNPAKEFVSIEIAHYNDQAIMRVMNLRGEQLKLFSYEFPKSTFYIGDLPQGVYLIEIDGIISRFLKD